MSDDSRPLTVTDGPRFAFGTLTVLPVTVRRWDRRAARGGMCWAPAVGLVLGLFGAAVAGVLLLLGSGSLIAAVATVAVWAALSRALHLDGLADVADGLGSGRPAEGALAVMKRSDIGPFGVLTLLLVLLAQVAALAELYAESWALGAFAAALGAVTARTALTLTARHGVPAARPDGLGAVVAEVVPAPAAWGAAGAVTVLAGLAAWPLFGGGHALLAAAAVLAGLACAQGLLRHCLRRLGGVTGDVFGAVCEVAATAALLILTFG
ncbi:adenosylcobinamide-GDP ribazoletransferase [Streptomyces alkaliterrae]|uniref:Adenosylcobinamide-GDP ribazoletransferase n=1 Tax=Streptomyces alkaliterrae TaxID=2213162 RepID=A0A5P0YUN3_9ACTN|nr:adenosylcobinamide-GDP ribazoletransferase [Streptomyces alkaliterrae]MBB1255548.1 adenosylcobinamide-GDP ribazoletransferase [Streptomyces alkaliterrae]MBB1260529.1 adenosylcobinamide-GDP ribazoletransferase [Streptomyces alkaliterrae]MQS04015.1 adenosylcobinamide-GDP ribazoletransferase [Streptomyces alkaliterrae]